MGVYFVANILKYNIKSSNFVNRRLVTESLFLTLLRVLCMYTRVTRARVSCTYTRVARARVLCTYTRMARARDRILCTYSTYTRSYPRALNSLITSESHSF